MGRTRVIKRVHFCKHFVEKVGGKTKIYSKIYKELFTGQGALRHCLFQACPEWCLRGEGSKACD